jgi:hypothetical protein
MLQIGLALLGVVLVVAVVNFWLLIPAAVMFAFIYVMRVYYVSTSRSIKRLEGISKLTCYFVIQEGCFMFPYLVWVSVLARMASSDMSVMCLLSLPCLSTYNIFSTAEQISIKFDIEVQKVKLSLSLTNEALCHEGVWGNGCIY